MEPVARLERGLRVGVCVCALVCRLERRLQKPSWCCRVSPLLVAWVIDSSTCLVRGLGAVVDVGFGCRVSVSVAQMAHPTARLVRDLGFGVCIITDFG